MELVEVMGLGLITCGGVEDVRSVLTLVRREAAQVCHVLRVEELRKQLEVEEEDGDRGGRGRSRKWRGSNQGECAMSMTMDGCEIRSELEP